MSDLEERIIAGVASGIVSGIIVAFVMYQLFGKETAEVVAEQTEILRDIAEAQGVPQGVPVLSARATQFYHVPRF